MLWYILYTQNDINNYYEYHGVCTYVYKHTQDYTIIHLCCGGRIDWSDNSYVVHIPTTNILERQSVTLLSMPTSLSERLYVYIY